MTAPGHGATGAPDETASPVQAAKEQAGAVAHTAGTAAGDLAGAVGEQAGVVLDETKQQVKTVLAEVRSTAVTQWDRQSTAVADNLRDLSTQLRTGDTSGLAGRLMGEAGQQLQRLSGYLDQVGPQGMLDDVRRYARRRPGTFLVTAAVAGFAGGRLVKGIQAGAPAGDRQPQRAGSPQVDSFAGLTAPGAGVPVAGFAVSAAPGSNGPAPVSTPPGTRTGSDLPTVTRTDAPRPGASGFDLTGTPVVPISEIPGGAR